MSNEVMVSNYINEMFGEIRVIVSEDNAVLFCGSDIARALGYKNVNQTMTDHCRCVSKRYVPHPQSPDKTIEMSFIPESDVFRLVFSSKLPEAERFTDWITKEVIPSVLRTGRYVATDDSPACHSERSAEMLDIRTERLLLDKDREIFKLERENFDLTRQLEQKSADLAALEAKIDEDPADDRFKDMSILDQPSLDRIQGGYKPHGKLTMRAIHNLYLMRIDIACCDSKDGHVTASDIAKDYGMSDRNFNNVLQLNGLQKYEPNGQYWIPDPKLFGAPERGECYHIRTVMASNGKKTCYWTALGWQMLFRYLASKANVFPDAWQHHIEDSIIPILANRYKAEPDEPNTPQIVATPRKTVF